jgi:DNA-binding CsgD family transcriptional regulator
MADGQLITDPIGSHRHSRDAARHGVDPMSFASCVATGEALLTRNEQLQKALSLEHAKSATLRRILGCLHLPILSLCPRLSLRSFTAEAGVLFGITQGDVGRVLAAPSFDPEGVLMTHVRATLDSGLPQALDVEFTTRHRFLCRMLPFRASQHEELAMDGVILAFIATASAPVGTDDMLPLQAASDKGLAARHPKFGLGLSPRQHQVLGKVLAGHPSKNIATDLGISRRTVESHRAAIMQRTGATSLPALARMAVGADGTGDCRTLSSPVRLSV